MAYQPPGPYPVMPMQPAYGIPPRPPIPQAALRSYYAIVTGAVLNVAGLIIALSELGSIRSQVSSELVGYDPATVNTFMNLETAAVVAGGVIGVLLWLWMAWKIKTGRHWARVLSSVFFGLECLATLAGGLNYSSTVTLNGRTTTVTVNEPKIGVILAWVTVAVGLYALVMFWHKSNAAFFRPQKFAAPVYPYPYPPQGYPQTQYPQAQYPQVPGQGGFGPGPQDGVPQQPGDPWSTPPQ
jgi:hypothetical protein